MTMGPNFDDDLSAGNLAGNLAGNVAGNPLAGPAGAGQCQPLQCETAMSCIEGARNPSTSPLDLAGFRNQLSHCGPCTQAFNMEVRLRSTMTPTMSELPPPDLALRINQTLASVNLDDLEITDF